MRAPGADVVQLDGDAFLLERRADPRSDPARVAVRAGVDDEDLRHRDLLGRGSVPKLGAGAPAAIGRKPRNAAGFH
jgi:hypothetical protein